MLESPVILKVRFEKFQRIIRTTTEYKLRIGPIDAKYFISVAMQII